MREVHGFISDTARAVAQERPVVLLIDSTEKLSDTEESGDRVKSSVRTLFAQHPGRLRLPAVHTVYSIPPDLPIREPKAVQASYEGSIWSLAAVTVEPEPKQGADPARADAGIDAMLSVLRKRHDQVGRLVRSDDELRELAVASGGNLRNLLFLVRQVIGRAFEVPASRQAVDGAMRQLASDFRWLTSEEKKWLEPIVRTGQPVLNDDEDRIRFADFLDRQVVLPHRNGEDWFAIAKPVRELL